MSVKENGAAAQNGRQGLVMLAGVMFTALALLAFAINSAPLTALDRSVWAWFDVHQSPAWHVDADGWFSYLGKPFHVAAVGLGCGTLLAVRARSAIPAFLVIGAVAVGVLVEHALKAVIERRADITAMFPLAYHHSFPSGHVTGSLTLLGTIALCFGVGRTSAVKTSLAGLVAAGVLTVALLALYSYAHTFTDVIGGGLLGGGIVALAALVLQVMGVTEAPGRRLPQLTH